jgi:hypothetical protein
MLTSKKRNRFGQIFILMECNVHQTRVVEGDDEIIVDATLHQMIRAWDQWCMNGMLVQRAFPFLNANQREFIMTGKTQAQWEEMLKDNEGTDH